MSDEGFGLNVMKVGAVKYSGVLPTAAELRYGHAVHMVHLLREARDQAKRVNATQTLKRIRAALRSAEGAVRHAKRYVA